MSVFEKTVISKYEPKQTNVNWIDTSGEKPVEKYFINGKWQRPSDEDTKNSISITYSDLKTLRDTSKLIPGTWYRITDYQCTTTQQNTQAANHQFDIIVRADDANVLNENAYAAHHEGDTYFANSKLGAWELKYCLDNDDNRFAWADIDVQECIYDDGMNLCPRDSSNDMVYDGSNYYGWTWFGNHTVYTISATPSPGDSAYFYSDNMMEEVFYIERYQPAHIGNGKGIIYYMKDEFGNECHYDFKNIQFRFTSAIPKPGIVANVYYYTFSVVSGTNDATVTDHSLNGGYCHDNKIGQCFTVDLHKLVLPHNVFRNGSSTSHCYSNTFGYGCYNNTFGYGCYLNIFGNGFYSNTFGAICISNTFGDRCDHNTFEGGCRHNTFKNECIYNTFGDSCTNNTLGERCRNIYLGQFSVYNTFGNYCTYNTLGNYCKGNTFGNTCYSIKFGDSSSTKSYYKNVIVENGNQYIYLTTDQTTSSSTYLQNIRIALGVNNTTTYKTITHPTVGDTFQTTYQPTNSQVISV